MLNKIKDNKIIYRIFMLMIFIVICGFTYNFIVFDIREAILFLFLTLISLCSEALVAFMFIKMDIPFNKKKPIVISEQYKNIQNLIFILTLFVCLLLHIIKPRNEFYEFNLGIIWAGGVAQRMNYIIRTDITRKNKRVGIIISSIIFCFLIGWVIYYFDK